MSFFPFLDAGVEHYVEAAELYASLRRHGVIVPPVDALIAVHAIRADTVLLTRDRHFDEIARHSALRLS